MKKIELGRSRYALVDDAVYEDLTKYRWYAVWCKHTQSYYAFRKEYNSELQRVVTVQMHRQLLGLQRGDKRQGDHIVSGATLDNRFCNLRVASNAQNQWNTRKCLRKASSQYKGVHYRTHVKKWCARIMKAGIRYNLGYFETENLAAEAYNKAASELFGAFARLNEIKDKE
jgi:hypothetical protein